MHPLDEKISPRKNSWGKNLTRPKSRVKFFTHLGEKKTLILFDERANLRDEFFDQLIDNFFIQKYGISALKIRLGCPYTIHRYPFTIMFYHMYKRSHWRNSIFKQKSTSKLKMQLIRNWQPNIEKMYATRHLKAQTSYFCMIIIWVPLGYHMVPKISICEACKIEYTWK